MLLWGSFGFLATLVPKRLADKIGARLWLMGTLAVGVTAVTTLARLPLEAAMIGDGWGDAFNPGVLVPLLTATSVGTGWLVEAAAMLVLIGASFITPPRQRHWGMALAAGLALVALTFKGHAVMHPGMTGALQRLNDAIHVLSSGAWIGALVALVFVLARLERDSDGDEARLALRRFSFAGHFAVALTIVTGALNTWLIVGGAPLAWGVPYQALLSVKIVLVLGMAGLASANRYLIAPKLGADGPATARAIRIGAIREVVVAGFVLALVAVFGLLNPV